MDKSEYKLSVSGGRRFKSRSSKFFFVHPKFILKTYPVSFPCGSLHDIYRKKSYPFMVQMHVKETRTLIVKEKGLAPVFLDSRLEHPAGWICAQYKSPVFIIIIPSLPLPRLYRNLGVIPG